MTGPTPTPGTTPTPTPAPTATPTPTASKEVPRAPQFVFVGDPGSPLMTGFRINSDGALTPVPGSPFSISAAVQAETSLPGTLIVATQTSINVFTVDREAGSIQQIDSIKASGVQSLHADAAASAIFATTQQGTIVYRMSNGKLQPLSMEVASALTMPKENPSMAMLDGSGQFMYVMNQSKAEIQAFRVDQGRPQPLTPSAYPASRGANSITLVSAP